MNHQATAPSWRFFLAVGLVLVFGIGSVFGLIYGPSSYATVDHLRQLRYHDSTFHYLPIGLSAAGYERAKLLLLGGVLISGALLGVQWRTRGPLYRELAALRQEWQLAPALLTPWRRLRPAERRCAALLFGLLTLLRAYYLLAYPLYGDELVSFQCFVQPGIVAATSFYPIPNNHILYSALCWLFSQASPNVYWAMRAPTLLISTIGTAVVGLLLLRHVGFRVAALTVLLFGFFPYALFQAVVGRGYFLLAVCAQVGFVALLALLRDTPRPRLAWLVLLLSSLIGLYAMPTYLLVFASLYAALGLRLLWQRRASQLWLLVLAGLLTGLLTVLLYAPVLLVSGPRALFGNDYVVPGAGHTTALQTLTYFRSTEGLLLGYEPWGFVASLVLSGLAWWRSRAARSTRLSWLIASALLMLWLPYALLIARGVYPPVRVLSYRMFFLLMLGALLQEWVLSWRPLRRLRAAPLLVVGVPVLLWAVVGMGPFQRRATAEAQRNARVQQVCRWLRARGAHAVLANHAHYQVYLQQYSTADHWPLRIDAAPAPGHRYDYRIASKNVASPTLDSASAILENADVRIYSLTPPAGSAH